MHHETGDKGDVGVAKAISDLITKGFLVLTPIAATTPFDLVAYKDKKFFKIQVKYRAIWNNKLLVSLRRAIIVGGKASYRRMNEEECDVVCIYCPDTDKCYYINRTSFYKSLTLRFGKTKNNQVDSVRNIEEYENFPMGC